MLPAWGPRQGCMRRRVSLLASLFVLASVLVRTPADGAVSFVASFELGSAPSWQTGSAPATRGTWIKHSSPVVANMGSEGKLIIVGSQGGKLYAFRYSNGALTKAWDTGSAIETYIDSSPAIGDLNSDGCPEVLVGAGNEYRPYNSGVHVFDCHGSKHRFWKAPGHAKPNHVGVFSTPAIGDVNGDGDLEVAYGSFNQKIYLKDRNGADMPGWPRENYDTVWSSPSLADTDADGKKEIIIGTDLGGGAAVWTCAKGIRGTMSVFNYKGQFKSHFPRCIDTPIWSSPAVWDLNGDHVFDIVVGTNNYLENGKPVGVEKIVRAWNSRTGGLLWDTNLGTGNRIFSSPAVGDVGGDGKLDIAIGAIDPANYGEVYLLDAKTGAIRWHREGGHRSVCACQFMGSPVIADVSGDGKPDVIAASEDGGVNAWDRAGTAVIKDLHAPPRPGKEAWQYESYMFFNSPVVSDLDGNGTNEIVLASAISGSNPLRGKVWIVQTPGRGTGPWPMFKRLSRRTSSK
jgi:FG-GAP repeat protein